MILEVKLYEPAPPMTRYAGRGGVTGNRPYVFDAPVVALQRIKWGPNRLLDSGIRVLAIVPEAFRRYLPRRGPLRVSEDRCWVTADIGSRNESNAAKVQEFIASGAMELNLEAAG